MNWRVQMRCSKLVIAGTLAAATWCGASQAQTILYGVDYGAGSTGTTPELSNTSPYPKHPGNAGFAVSTYWDNGVQWERRDPVVVDPNGTVRYVYPETARAVPPPDRVYVRPDTAPAIDSRTVIIRTN
jgi:hypothetical protein